MTAVKCKQEYKTLLDFSKTDRRVSKNSVKQLLRQAELPSYRRDIDGVIHINYGIKIGIYHMNLVFDLDHKTRAIGYGGYCSQEDHKVKLKEYGEFYMELTELAPKEYTSGTRSVIWTESDRRFKSQYWSQRRTHMRINDLINAIVYCSRLNSLKVFL